MAIQSKTQAAMAVGGARQLLDCKEVSDTSGPEHNDDVIYEQPLRRLEGS